jgi:hypothetical protein
MNSPKMSKEKMTVATLMPLQQIELVWVFGPANGKRIKSIQTHFRLKDFKSSILSNAAALAGVSAI